MNLPIDASHKNGLASISFSKSAFGSLFFYSLTVDKRQTLRSNISNIDKIATIKMVML